MANTSKEKIEDLKQQFEQIKSEHMEKERIHKLRIESLKNKYVTDVQRSDHNEPTSNPTKSDTKDGVMSETLKNYIES